MKPLQQSGFRMAALVLASAVLLQVCCRAGLLPIETRSIAPARHSGCHESAPPDTPAPQPQCCTAAPAAKAYPLARYVAPAPLVVAWSPERGFFHSESLPPASTGVLVVSDPPGLQVLRV